MSPRRFRTLRLFVAAQIIAFCVIARPGTAAAQPAAPSAPSTVTPASQAALQQVVADLERLLTTLKAEPALTGEVARLGSEVAALREQLKNASVTPAPWWGLFIPWGIVVIVGVFIAQLWSSARAEDNKIAAQKLTNERELKPKVLELEGQKQRLEQIFALLMKSDAAGDATKLLERIEALEQTVCRIGTPAHDAWPKPAGK